MVTDAVVLATGAVIAAVPAALVGYLGLRQARANHVQMRTGNGSTIAEYVMALDVKVDRIEQQGRSHDRRDANAFALLGVTMEQPEPE